MTTTASKPFLAPVDVPKRSWLPAALVCDPGQPYRAVHHHRARWVDIWRKRAEGRQHGHCREWDAQTPEDVHEGIRPVVGVKIVLNDLVHMTRHRFDRIDISTLHHIMAKPAFWAKAVPC